MRLVPITPASEHALGTKKRGCDKRMYVVRKNASGAKRWSLVVKVQTVKPRKANHSKKITKAKLCAGSISEAALRARYNKLVGFDPKRDTEQSLKKRLDALQGRAPPKQSHAAGVRITTNMDRLRASRAAEADHLKRLRMLRK